MKVLSLFDGISCGRVALERASIPVERYVAYEIDDKAIKISQKNHSDIEYMGDVMTADFYQYEGFDLLMGGSPCQSLSIIQSKTRQGLDGKSKLFFEFVRALEEVKPKYFLFENVASMSDESRKTISMCLGCKPVLIDSADFSAQSRPRFYWTNIPLTPVEQTNKQVLKDILESTVDPKYWYTDGFDFLGDDKVVCAKLHINGHDLIKRVNSPNFKCQTLTAVCGGNHQKKVLINDRVRKLTPVEYERLQTLDDGYTEGFADTHRYRCLGNAWTVDVIVHIFKSLKED